MVVGVTMRSALAASAIAAASAKKGKKRRRTLLTPCSGRNGVDDAVGGTAESWAVGFGRTRDWSGLPELTVHLILTALLPSLADAISLGSVCKAWRSVFAACKRELFLALPPLLVDCGSSPRALGGFYSLRERRFHRRKQPDFWRWVYCGGRQIEPTMNVIGVSHGYWIVLAKPRWWNGPRRAFLMDPLSPEVRIRLPQVPHGVMSAVMAAPPASPDCVVVLLENERILYCRPGDTQWVRHSLVEGADYNDAPRTLTINLMQHLVAIVGGKLYTLHTNGKVVMVELFPRPTVTFLDTKPLPEKSRYFLMESNGEILHIADRASLLVGGFTQCSKEEHKFIVRRLDISTQEWVTLSTLGDRCLFLKWGATGVAPARWGGEGDCIYTFCSYLSALLVFHMKDGRVEHHQMPKEYRYYDWLTPSFCYL